MECLANDLTEAGFKVSFEGRKDIQSFGQLTQEIYHDNTQIYFLPEVWVENQQAQVIQHELDQCSSTKIFFFPNTTKAQATPKQVSNFTCINPSDWLSYYHSVYIILKKVLPGCDLDAIFSQFEKSAAQYQFSADVTSLSFSKNSWEEKDGILGQRSSVTSATDPSFPQVSVEEKIVGKGIKKALLKAESFFRCNRGLISVFSLVLTFGFFYLEFLRFKRDNPYETSVLNQSNLTKQEDLINQPIRADLVIPSDSTLLNRSGLLEQINSHFKKQSQGIQTLALIGIGGAGKTTIARQYARSQILPVVWEINAETPESLRNSFETLAYTFSTKREEDKKVFRELQDTKNPLEKERKIVLFIQENLRSQRNWLLIYDNVEQFSDIQKYFPSDPNVWGKGNVILTTRDSLIQNNNHINLTIQIGELDPDQKLKLFCKIMNHNDISSLSGKSMQQTEAFLNNIPSFPLDVSTAAYYLKATSVPFEQYLNSLEENNKNFSSIQENLIKETSGYTQSRHRIISVSLQRLSQTNKDFGDLLLLMSLIDSQNIPRTLLECCRDKYIVDALIYYMRKYSFLHTLDNKETESFISLHRSTQKVCLEYLITSLPTQEKTRIFASISKTLTVYMLKILETEDFTKMKNLIPHLKVLLSHNRDLSTALETSLYVHLGTIYYYLNQYQKAKDYLEKSLAFSEKYDLENCFVIQSLDYLGIVLKNLEYYEEAKHCLEKSLSLQRKYNSENLNQARTLSFLGGVYRYLGKYKKAQNMLEASLTQYKAANSGDLAGISRCLSYLGEIYRIVGDFNKARDVLEESLKILARNPMNPLRQARVLGELGRVYRILGIYGKAQSSLNESRQIYSSYLSNDHEDTAWSSILLGSTYEEIGYFDKAKMLLEKSLAIYKRGENNNSIPIAWASAHLASVLCSLGEYKKAKTLLMGSLDSYKQHYSDENIERAWISYLLGCLLSRLAEYESATQLLQESLNIYEKNYGKDHFILAYPLLELGKISMQQMRLGSSEKYLHEAEILFQSSRHPNIYLVFEELANLYLKKAQYEKNSQQAVIFKNEAARYLTNAFRIAKEHFPTDSSFIKRISTNIDDNVG